MNEKISVCHVYIDSRSRASGIPASSQFVLNRSLHSLSQIMIRSFSFSNTIYNIDDYNNKLFVTDGGNSGAIIVLPPKFYTTGEFVQHLNTKIKEFVISVDGLGSIPLGTGDMLSSINNTLVWNLPGRYMLTGGSMSDVVGMYQPFLRGRFETPLTLSSPQAISVICREVQSSTENINVQKNNIGYTPLLICSLQKGYGSLEVYEPQTPYAERFDIRDTDRLSFLLSDPRTGRIPTEITSWSLILQIVSKFKKIRNSCNLK